MRKTLLVLVLFGLAGCESVWIQNDHLRDRIIACSAGFSNEVTGELEMAYEETLRQGKAGAHFKQYAQSIIFSQMPPGSRLKAYEDYLMCIERQWNE